MMDQMIWDAQLGPSVAIIFTQNSKFDIYDRKWSKFLNIYDYRGPDNYEIF